MSTRHPLIAMFAVFAVMMAPSAAGGESSSLTIQPSIGPPTSLVEVTGTGFAADEPIGIFFDSKSRPKTIADQSGGFSETIKAL